MIVIDADDLRGHGMPNYTQWDHWIPDHTYADDGFGFLHMTELDMFWFNVDRFNEGVH